jgi:erythromycin esterase-like protein
MKKVRLNDLDVVNQNADRVAKNLAACVYPFQLSELLSSNANLAMFFDANIPMENEILLLGESTHGTEEFYQIRQQLTKHLIQTRDYRLILIEAEWPDVYVVNQYITNSPHNHSANGREALSNITGSGKHMWHNQASLDLVEWLKEHNKQLNYQPDRITYLFGIDCQQIYRSLSNLFDGLHELDLQYCSEVKTTLAFFNGFGNSEWEYAAKTVGQIGSELIPEVLQKVLSEFQWQKFEEFKKKLPIEKLIDLINVEQNFEVLISAEEYFRKRQLEPRGSQVSWNTRDQHMTLVVSRLRDRLKLLTHAHADNAESPGMRDSGGFFFPTRVIVSFRFVSVSFYFVLYWIVTFVFFIGFSPHSDL